MSELSQQFIVSNIRYNMKYSSITGQKQNKQIYIKNQTVMKNLHPSFFPFPQQAELQRHFSLSPMFQCSEITILNTEKNKPKLLKQANAKIHLGFCIAHLVQLSRHGNARNSQMDQS